MVMKSLGSEEIWYLSQIRMRFNIDFFVVVPLFYLLKFIQQDGVCVNIGKEVV